MEGEAVRSTKGLILTIAGSRSPGGVRGGRREKDEHAGCIPDLWTSLL